MRQPGPAQRERRAQLVVAAEQRAAAVQHRQALALEPLQLPERLADPVELAAHVGAAEQHRAVEPPEQPGRLELPPPSRRTETPFARNAAASERFVALLRSATITSPGELMRYQSSLKNVREG